MQQGMQQQSPYGQGSGFTPPGPVGPRTLAPGARVAGALICAVLVAVEIVWTVRDIKHVGFHDTLWSWLGLDHGVYQHALLATAALDGVLLVVLLGALVWSARPAAGWAFVTAGVFAFGYRLPGLWIFRSDWTAGAQMHTRALSTAIAFALGGIALVVIGLAGRRPVRGGAQAAGVPVGGAPPGSAPYDAAPYDAAPSSGPGAATVGPRRGAAVTAGVLLVLLAIEGTGWQIFYMHKYTTANDYPPHFYQHLLTGEGTLTTLLGMPAAYAGWLQVAFALLVAWVAFAKSAAARALGVAFGFMLVLYGVIGLDNWNSYHELFEFDHLPLYQKSQQIFLVVELVVGLAVLVLLSVPGRSTDGPRPVPGWGPPPQGYGAAPGSVPGSAPGPVPGSAPGSAPAPGGWSQPPHVSPYSQPPQQPPAGGGFGPPPQLPPQSPPGYPPPPPGFPQEPGGDGR
ncbi:hypothetical protein [Streptomyces sp. CBMA29]|uniref:hypothetical protein n=1 Tax=Streptomyces sp. CBMA29 TaxID=1896314 RepID=UPI001661CB8A|nr:hypothetical protein [Streptomyces sp. CBMA29]